MVSIDENILHQHNATSNSFCCANLFWFFCVFFSTLHRTFLRMYTKHIQKQPADQYNEVVKKNTWHSVQPDFDQNKKSNVYEIRYTGKTHRTNSKRRQKCWYQYRKTQQQQQQQRWKKSEEAFIQLWALFRSYFIVRSEFRNIESRESSRQK